MAAPLGVKVKPRMAGALSKIAMAVMAVAFPRDG
jgi:hypothetical protein